MPCFPPLSELRRLLAAEPGPSGHLTIGAVSTDSRRPAPGSLYVALRGERFDGHAFVEQALQRGATAAVVDRRWHRARALDDRLVRVASPLGAYQALGRWWRLQLDRPLVAVTGSVGKTTTKELVVAALASLGPVLSTRGNFNNEFGVPGTLLQLQPEHRAIVVEMGMRGAGQIRELAETARPDIAVITNVGTAHIGLLGSRRAIARAKCELLETLSPRGVAILNGDDPLLLETAARVWSGKTITFGIERGGLKGAPMADGTLRVEDQTIEPPLPGAHNALNLLGALAVARELGVPWAALRRLEPTLPRGRSRTVGLAGGATVLDETYNAGLESTLAALKLLAGQPARRRIAVLGTMKELGAHSEAIHREVGEAVTRLGIHQLLILADPTEAKALSLGAAGTPQRQFAGRAELTDYLHQHLGPGDCVLLKASRAVALDEVVASLENGRR